jgi:hypothetical protein
MKNLVVLFVFALSVLGVACQDTNSISRIDKIHEIAMSDSYTRYQENMYKRAYIVTINAHDLNAVDAILRAHPDKMEIIDFDKALFKDVRGGDLYYEIELETYNVLKELKEKYQYNLYSLEERIEMQKIFDAADGGRQMEKLRKKVNNFFTKKN